MVKKLNLVLINHSFQVNYFCRRWELFAEQHPEFEVYLLSPKKYEWYKDKTYQYDKSINKILESESFDKENYHRRVFRIKTVKILGWYSPDFKKIFDEIKPNIIYHLGIHNMLSLRQVLILRSKYYPKTKVIAFSMRGPALNLVLKKSKCSPVRWVARRFIYWYLKNQLNYINSHINAFFCHYPKAVECFRMEGYTGPIYMQTQVGVNEEWFHEDKNARKEIRKKYNIANSTFVFGSATRFSQDKGLDVILRALPTDGDWKYLMMGSGSDEDKERLREIIRKRHLEEKVIETGMVDWYDMAKYWNAVDCAIHVPLTTPQWEETFSLSAIQPQITKKPVIGDTSGSVPYQIGFEDMIVPEGDVNALHEKILWVLTHQEEAAEIGKLMYKRTHNCFEVQHLDDMFYDTLIEDILPGTYDLNKVDMVTYIPNKRNEGI